MKKQLISLKRTQEFLEGFMEELRKKNLHVPI